MFVKDVHPKLCELFKGLNIQNGILNIQFFVEENVIYAYDPGFRLQGEAPDIYIANINGFNHKEMLINYAFTGVFGDNDLPEKNDYRFKGKIGCTIWVLLKAGTIDSIQGLKEIKADETVVFIMQRFKTGDTIEEEWLGTEKQVFARIYVVGSSIQEINKKIREFENLLGIVDTNGENMILDWLEPFNEDDYS